MRAGFLTVRSHIVRNHQRGEPDRLSSALAVITAVIVGAILYVSWATGFAEFLYNLLKLLTS